VTQSNVDVVRNGKIVRVELYASGGAARKAAGLHD
jgi:hypothetical protein